MSSILHFENEKLVFFLVPKAATTTIRGWLAPLITDKPVREIKNLVRQVDWKPTTRSEFKRSFADDHLSFAVVRNPWTRIVSAYNDKIDRDELYPHLAKQGFEARMSFMDFLDHFESMSDSKIDVHFRSQWRLICDTNDKLLPNMIVQTNEIAKLYKVLNLWCGGKLAAPEDVGERNKTKRSQPVRELLPNRAAHRRFRDMLVARSPKEMGIFEFQYPYMAKRLIDDDEPA